jgi:ATP-dependent RNA helicase HelY
MIPEQQAVSLESLYQLLNPGEDNITGVLQSLLSKKQLVMASGEKGEVFFARPEADLEELGRALGAGGWTYNQQFLVNQMVRVKSDLKQRAEQAVLDLLADGRPRTGEELADLLILPAGGPGGISGVIELPDGSLTIKSTSAGQAELARRKEEAEALAAAVERQRKILKELVSESKAVTGGELLQALGEPVLPDAIAHLVKLGDGSYALPDSRAALQDIIDFLQSVDSLGRQEFYRMFKAHKKTVASVKKGREAGPLIILPDGRVTVATTPAGQAELQRREVLAAVSACLDELAARRAFVRPEDFLPRLRGFAEAEAGARGWIRMNLGGKQYWCSPKEYKPEVMAEELKELAGQNLRGTGKPITPAVFLLENSRSPKEAAKRLGLKPAEIGELTEAGHLQGFELEGSPRLWRLGVEALNTPGAIEQIIRRTEKIRLVDAARVLGVAPELVRRMVREGYLSTAGKSANGPRGLAYLVRRADVEEILPIKNDLIDRWEHRDRRRDADRGIGPRAKRKPARRKQEPLAVPSELVLDPFQEESIGALLAGRSVLVAAPTGTGKTLVAEKIISKVLGLGQEVIYTSPLKALSNQKFRDFGELFGKAKVGLITGDISINDRAPLLVMTTEIFRNWCFANPGWMDQISHVIFDEIHYLDDTDRGTAWEESIIFAPPHIKILGLSATVPNIQELAAWIAEVRGFPVKVVVETRRAVPLEISWISPRGEVLNEAEAREEIEDLRQGDGSEYMLGDDTVG